MKKQRSQSGFSLALTMAVITVLVLLASAIFADVLASQRGAVITRDQAGLLNDAQLGLEMAEAEMYKNAGLMLYTTWSATTSADFNDTSTSATDSPAATVSAADYLGTPFPVRQLTFIGNARNWPAFCDWTYYIQSFKGLGGTTYPPVSTTTACCGFAYLSTSSIGTDPLTSQTITLEQDATPSLTAGGSFAPPFDESDPCLTNGWWLVPRDDNADDDYFPGGGCVNTGLKTYSLPNYDGAADGIVFPSDIVGATYSVPAPAPITTIYYEGHPYSGQNIQVVPHLFWYENFPVCGQITATSSILPYTVWPNAMNPSPPGGEYGTGTCAATGSAGLMYTGTGATLGGSPPPQMFDTPVYKKVYTLQSGREVAVYCRLDLRDYFPPACTTCASYTWPYGGTQTMGYRDGGNTLRFYLVAVPEGRVDLTQNGGAIYRPGTPTNKFIYFGTGGAENAVLATGSDSLPNFGLTDLHAYPTILGSDAEMLPSGKTTRIAGYRYRGDGNRGFNWDSYPSSPPTFPISQQRMGYIWEEQPNSTAASYDLYFLGIGGRWLTEYASGSPVTSQAGWTVDRYPFSDSTESFGATNSASLEQSAAQWQFDTAGSFSGVVDPSGQFGLDPASRDLGAPASFSDGTADRWDGPVAGATYSTAIWGPGDRPSLPFAASYSAVDTTR